MGNSNNNTSIVVAVLVVFISSAVAQVQITLYHYTNKGFAEAIIKSGYIEQSKQESGDALFGDGVYLTSLDPSHSKEYLAKNNYDDGFQKALDEGKLDMYIKVVLPRDDVEDLRKKAGRNVYLYKGNLILKDFSYGCVGSVSDGSGCVSSGGLGISRLAGSSCFACYGRLGIVLVIAQVMGITANF